MDHLIEEISQKLKNKKILTQVTVGAMQSHNIESGGDFYRFIGEFSNGKIISTISSNPLKIIGLALYNKNKMRVIIANLNNDAQKVVIKNLNRSVHIRYLDENNFYQAVQSPEVYRTQKLEKKSTLDGNLKLNLLPFSLASIDSSD